MDLEDLFNYKGDRKNIKEGDISGLSPEEVLKLVGEDLSELTRYSSATAGALKNILDKNVVRTPLA